jgi:hypothetical protein
MIRREAKLPNPMSRRSIVHNAREKIPAEDRKFAAERDSMRTQFTRSKRKAREENGDAGLDVKNPLNPISSRKS